jgi:hypothetical protein
MKIFRALGLGLVILILQATMGSVFNSFENMLITFFDTTSVVLETSQTQLSSTKSGGGISFK